MAACVRVLACARTCLLIQFSAVKAIGVSQFACSTRGLAYERKDAVGGALALSGVELAPMLALARRAQASVAQLATPVPMRTFCALACLWVDLTAVIAITVLTVASFASVTLPDSRALRTFTQLFVELPMFAVSVGQRALIAARAGPWSFTILTRACIAI